MKAYETLFITSPLLLEEEQKAMTQKVLDVIATKGGEVENVDEWGKRRLAYEINDRTEGYYYLVDFKADGEFPKELDRQFRINENILRTIIIRKDEE